MTKHNTVPHWIIGVSQMLPALFVLFFAVPALASQLTMTWSDNATNEDGYYVDRKIGADGTYQRFATLPANSTSYTDTSVQDGVTYCYRVSAYNSAGTSTYSNEGCKTASATSGTASAAPGTSSAGTSSVASSDPPAATGASTSGSGGGGGGGCFIATAAFGSPLAPQVQLLRDLRDRYLLPTTLGRAFVHAYYRVSPPIADVIRQSEPLRAAVRVALLPVLGLAAVALWSPALGVGVSLLPVALCAFLVGRRRSK